MSELRLELPAELVERLAERAAEIVLERLAARGDSARRRFVTVSEAAALIGLSERGVRAQVARGRLRARRLGNRILVDLDSLENPG